MTNTTIEQMVYTALMQSLEINRYGNRFDLSTIANEANDLLRVLGQEQVSAEMVAAVLTILQLSAAGDALIIAVENARDQVEDALFEQAYANLGIERANNGSE